MIMSEKCRNNNSDNPLTSRRTDGGKDRYKFWKISYEPDLQSWSKMFIAYLNLDIFLSLSSSININSVISMPIFVAFYTR